jgi:enoyl-CoA hydratase/carnithine racemase
MFADLAELDATLQRWAGDERARVIVLTGGIPGTSPRTQTWPTSGHSCTAARPPHGPEAWGCALNRISAIPQPVIAAVNGQAWGGGFELALSCLLRLASPAAHFRFPEVADGAIPGAGGTQRLPRLIGLPQAARLILGGELVTAREALPLGLVEALPSLSAGPRSRSAPTLAATQVRGHHQILVTGIARAVVTLGGVAGARGETTVRSG